MAVRLVDEPESRTLNRRFRGRDNATNVLSFPAGVERLPPGEPVPLGDLVICAPLVAAEAAAQNKTAMAHWCHLVVHGTLHLVGYDHDGATAAEEMEGLERQVLEKFGISDPY